MGALELPEELLLRCLRLLPALGSHFAVLTSCRALEEVAKDDRIWCEHLARDFPLASRAKPAGTLHRVYRIMAKSQLKTRTRRREGIGPASVWGADDFAADTAAVSRKSIEEDALEMPRSNYSAAPEIRRLAARFAEMNTDLEAHIPVQHWPVVIAPRLPQRPPPPPPPPRSAARANAGAVVPPPRPQAATGPNRAALLEEIRARAAARQN